ncbi:serum response factor-binding protein 1 [Cricetulus griseus]|nr:serum response factor-binding protein 1 [Cricetulus griseus]
MLRGEDTLNIIGLKVVKMRKEVKRIRVLVIRKLVRSVGRLKSKKGTEDALLKNQRRAQRLLEEIHAMKELKPDVITKSALGDDINFEKTCKKPDSTASERAIARLAVHPLLKKKIDALKAAVQAFKDARQNAPEAESSKNASEESQHKDTLCSKDDASELQHPERTIVSEQKGKDAKTVAKKAVHDSKEKLATIEHGPKAVVTPCSPGMPAGKDAVATSAHSQKAPADSKRTALTETTKKERESTLGENSGSEEEESEEEKEYFDDSTEERFYKQSSVSEDSDSGDDFFIGKVRRTRKKEGGVRSSAKEHKPLQKVSPKTYTLDPDWDLRNDKHKGIPDARKLESVFFHSLSGPKSSRRDFREQAPKNKTPDFAENEPPIKSRFTKSARRGFESVKQQTHAPLHPSWEASRRRKEQQSKITVFQGKKITFDD